MIISFELIKAFYETHLPDAIWKGKHLVAPCPFCAAQKAAKQGSIAILLNPESYFCGYFHCTQGCVPGGFYFHFGRLRGIPEPQIPGSDPDMQLYASRGNFPSRHLGADIDKFTTLMGAEQYDYFGQYGISQTTLKRMGVGFNGRYLVYPYFQENGLAYAARCIIPGREEDSFQHGNESFFTGDATIYNCQEIDRCQGGALFITEGELNVLILKELGYPAFSVQSASQLADIDPNRLQSIVHLFLVFPNTPEADTAVKEFAVRVGYKARILKLPPELERGASLFSLAMAPDLDTKKQLLKMIQNAKAFSPFTSPGKERRELITLLEKEKGRQLLGLATGFDRMDLHLEGLRGINIMGGPPKAGKSCFFMQISAAVARRSVPVLYYDFENGRQKIYLRTLVSMSEIPEKKIRSGDMTPDEQKNFDQSFKAFESLLTYFRVINDRRLTPHTMRRHIDFIQHETRKEDLLIVVDSLHKLPFKDVTERRSGIDAWLREMEAIRDEHHTCFLVISELSRGKGGNYGEKPDLGSFKESGDIAYSADNALILMPQWDPMSPTIKDQRKSILWVVASREASPGKVAEYELDYPYWRFKEIDV